MRHQQHLLQEHRNMYGCEEKYILGQKNLHRGLEGGKFSRWTSREGFTHAGSEM